MTDQNTILPNETYAYDIFLSHCEEDKEVVLHLIKRLATDGLRIWYYENECKAGERKRFRINAGLMASRFVVVAISKHSLASDWVDVEIDSVLAHDPANKNKRLILMRLDDTPITGLLAGFIYLDWRKESEARYADLLRAVGARKKKPSEIIERASIARVYDYFLDGTYNTAADREAAHELERMLPNLRNVMVSNRAFLRRSVSYLVKAGIKQFLDIGSGLPTAGNTHEIAQTMCPDAKVVYVDNDEYVVKWSRRLLADRQNVRVVLGDLTKPHSILSAPELKIIDFRKPVGLLLIAVLHFVTSDDIAHGCIGSLRRRLAPGSYIAISHACRPEGFELDTKPFGKTYRKLVARVIQRQQETLLQFFVGTDLIEPGVVFVASWHTDIKDPYLPAARLPFADEPENSLILAGLARIRNH